MSLRRFAAPIAGALALAAALTPALAAAPGVDRSLMDPQIAPGDDFYASANGAWEKIAQIPADRSTWSSGAEMRDLTDRRTAALIQSTQAAKAPAGSETRKIADFYASYMDEAGIEAKG